MTTQKPAGERWGIFASGRIVQRWLRGFRDAAIKLAQAGTPIKLVAVAGRTRSGVDEVCEKYKIPHRFYSYEELAASPEVDVIYIAAPHNDHAFLSELAIAHGKAVLCEKPVVVNSAQLGRIEVALKEKPTFFMEAFWTRMFPATHKLVSLLKDGAIGEVRQVIINFGFAAERVNTDRLFDPAKAGGALLDVGCYCLHFASIVFGSYPTKVVGLAQIEQGADEQTAFVAQYKAGQFLSATCSVTTQTVDTALIYGTRGMIRVPVFWKPTNLEVIVGGKSESLKFPVGLPSLEGAGDLLKEQPLLGVVEGEDEGYQYEILHLHECLQKGLLESPLFPLASSRAGMGVLDELRHQIGLRYPCE